MEITKGLTAEITGGKIVVAYELAQAVVPVIDVLKAKVESGEIDPIKGTDLDKEAMIKALEFLKSEITK